MMLSKVDLLIGLSVLMGATGQLLLKVSADWLVEADVMSQARLNPRILLEVLARPSLLVAIVLYGVGFILWIVVLSSTNLSYAYPLLALTYIFVPLLSSLLLHEQLTPAHLFGCVLIVLGVIVIKRS